MTSDISAIQDFINSALLGIIVNVLTLVGMVGVMLYINWRLTSVALSTRPSADAISFCSSAEGAHTFSMLTFTCGCWELPGAAGCCCAATGPPNNAVERKLQRIKKGILGTPEF